MPIDSVRFGVACYLVLCDHHGNGFQEAHPNYAAEKLYISTLGYSAYGHLDSQNQLRLKEYLERWGYELPKEVAETQINQIN